MTPAGAHGRTDGVLRSGAERALTPGRDRATLSPMGDLALDEVREIGTAAIRRVIGDTFTDATIGFAFGAEDSTYYLFTLRFPSETAWRRAVPLSSRMSLAIGDELWARGDSRIAFTRLLSDGSWDFPQNAAAE